MELHVLGADGARIRAVEPARQERDNPVAALEGVAIAPRLGLQALTRISRTIRSWPLHHRSDKSLNPHPRSG